LAITNTVCLYLSSLPRTITIIIGLKQLEATIEALQLNHTKAIGLLDAQLREKDSMINETDSKMSMISVYVDKLEERLASFAIARRDITNREKACDLLTEQSLILEEQVAKLKQEFEETRTERDEMKNLVDLLVEERALLQQEQGKLSNDKEKLIFEGQSLREELDLLNDNFLRLENDARITKEQLEEAQASISEREEALDNLKAVNDESGSKLAEQDDMIQKSVTLTMSMQKAIHRLQEEYDDATAMILMLEEKLAEAIGQQNRASQEQPAEVVVENAEVEEELKGYATESFGYATRTESSFGYTTESFEVDATDSHIPPPPPDGYCEGSNDEHNEQMDIDVTPPAPDGITCATINMDDDVTDTDTDTDTGGDKTFGEEATVGTTEYADSSDDEEVGFDDEEEALVGDDYEVDEPPLPNSAYTPTVPVPPPNAAFVAKRPVPLRDIRKQISKVTGIHGFFTPPSRRK